MLMLALHFAVSLVVSFTVSTAVPKQSSSIENRTLYYLHRFPAIVVYNDFGPKFQTVGDPGCRGMYNSLNNHSAV